MGADANDAMFLMVTLSLAAGITAATLWGGRRSLSKAGAKAPAVHTGHTQAPPAAGWGLYHASPKRVGASAVMGSDR